MNIKKSVLVLFFLLFFAAYGSAEVVPKPEGPVNDYAGVISPEYRQKLQSLITELESKTSAEIAVVTVESIAPRDEVSYARLIFDNWKIGKKGKDNGVLVLLAVKERRWRIETGYGVEGILPDGRCGEIGRAYMVGFFKNGRYGEGLYQGVAAIASVIAKDAHVDLGDLDIVPAPAGGGVSTKTPIAFFYIFVPIFFFVWNLPWPIYIGLPVTILFALVFSGISPYLGLLAVVSYIASMIFRFTYWRKLPRQKRRNFFGGQSYGGAWTTTTGGWGGRGGGFSGGFGGGFGGGGGGGGGAGGGF